MSHESFDKPLEGTVEADETYVDDKARGKCGSGAGSPIGSARFLRIQQTAGKRLRYHGVVATEDGREGRNIV